MFKLSHKELLEIKFWLTCNLSEEQDKLPQYLSIWGNPEKLYVHSQQCGITRWKENPDKRDGIPNICTCHLDDVSILEIGTGPQYGFLKSLEARLKYGVDPLYKTFHALGILAERDSIFEVPIPFEFWDTDLQFDAIFTANALDHGEMGFHLIPKIWKLLKPGGRVYLHVHLRPKDLLNILHDHSLTEKQLDKHLSYTNLVQVERKIFENDIDGKFCQALVGIWEKP
jgi:hypothetical protein